MNLKQTLRFSDFFSQIQDKTSFKKLNINSRYQGIVYDISYNGKFTNYNVRDIDDNIIEIPDGCIVARIIRIHDGVSAPNLPLFFPLAINQEIPVVGNKVWIISDSSGLWYWESIISRKVFTQEKMDNIEDTYGGRKKKISSAEDYKYPEVDITNNVDPNDILSSEFEVEKNKIDVRRSAGFPVTDTQIDLAHLPGENSMEGRFGNGMLCSYGDNNNGIIYIYTNRIDKRPAITGSNIMVLGEEFDIDKVVKESSKVYKYSKDDYPNSLKENFFVLNTDDIRVNVDGSIALGSDGNIVIVSGKEVIQKTLNNFTIKSDKIVRIQAINGIEIENLGGKIIINKEGIKIYTEQEINLESQDKISLKAKNIKIEADEKFEVKAKRVDILGLLKIADGTITFGQSIYSFVKNIFLSVYNTHMHISSSPGAPTSPPVVPADPVSMVTTKLKTSL